MNKCACSHICVHHTHTHKKVSLKVYMMSLISRTLANEIDHPESDSMHRICLLAKSYLWPPNTMLAALSWPFQDSEQWDLSSPTHAFPLEVKQGDPLLSSGSHTVNTWPLGRIILPYFSLMTLYVKRSPSIVLKGCLVFPSTRQWYICLRENDVYAISIQARAPCYTPTTRIK